MNKISKAWDKRSKKYGNKIRGVLPKSFPQSVNQHLDNWMYQQVKSQISNLKPQKILDLGCGYGRLSKKILRDFSKVKIYGIDVAKGYVDLYNKDLSPRGKAMKADIRKVPFRDTTFDVVFMVTTLMYLIKKTDHKKAMEEIFRVLKPSGKFVFIERNPVGYGLVTLGGLIETLRGKKYKEIKSVSFSKKYMLNLIEKSGGKVIHASGIPFWTLALPISFVIKKPIPKLRFLDEKLSFLLTPSMYISYIGEKR